MAVYADPDRDALFVRLADEAHSLGGATPADSYLDIAKIIAVAEKAGADSVHPGYGFLAENAGFAQAVIDAGLIWIGPPPVGDREPRRQGQGQAHRAEGQRPAGARHQGPGQGRRRGRRVREGERSAGRDQGGLRRRRPRPQGRPHPRGDPRALRVRGPRGGRGVRPRRVPGREVPRQAAARRDPVPGRPARQRRGRLHPRLLAPAPPPEAGRGGARAVPHRRPGRRGSTSRSKAILREAGYVGAGTCEFLVARDGTISFLEVNTRLQVEHCVSEEVTGIDLVREMFRIAAGEELGYDDPPVRGHSIEFRINAEDGGRNFMPAPGTLTAWQPPQGPGVRLDGGYENGETVPGSFDSLDRQAHRHRPRPHPGPGAVAARAGRVRRRRHAHRHPVPPRGGRRPGVRRRLHPQRREARSTSTRPGSRPTSTTRSSRTPATSPRPTSPPSASGSPSRSAASASRSCCPAGSVVWSRQARPAAVPSRSGRPARRPARPPAATP